MDALQEAALWALEHFEALDQANAKIHCAPVRYSPITFRLASALHDLIPRNDLPDVVALVWAHDGLYDLDPGR